MSSPLPFLPGYSFPDPNKTAQHRPQSFNFRNGVAVHDGPARPAATNNVQLPVSVSWKTENGGTPPNWVAFEKKTLKFEAYFEEFIENSKEQQRIRKCNIYYYLEDGTLMIDEPKIENSGLPQGTLVRRHKAQREDGKVITWEDFNLGVDFVIFGVKYHIADCDIYTTDFYSQAGIALNEAERRPSDPYHEYRSQMMESMRPVRQGKAFPDPLKKFLDHDGKVLRFYCLWEDKTSARGEIRKFVLLYFLADDTLQVLESLPPNSGRDPFPVFAKRQTPPKDFAGLASLTIGSTVTIFNRKLTIYTIDVYTQGYYRKNFGITDFTPLRVQQAEKTLPAREVPPYNGFGTEEDSLVSCLTLVPKPPKKDFQKLLGNDGKVLQFSATLVSKNPADKVRQFVVSYFLADDTMSIFEPSQRNTGMVSGKFLERRKLKKPKEPTLPIAAYSRTLAQQRPFTAPATTGNGRNSPSTPSSSSRPGTSAGSKSPSSIRGYSPTAIPTSPTPQFATLGRTSPSPPSSPGDEYYTAPDMHIGAIIEAFGRKFVLEDASEFALRHMETNAVEFPLADSARVREKLKEVMAGKESTVANLFAEADPHGLKYLSLTDFRKVLSQVCTDITDQEIVTIGRKFKNNEGQVAYAEFYNEITVNDVE